MFIYKITNLINGKTYIGQTIGSVENRWKRHCRENSGCPALSRAIKKYGKDNFKIETIDTAKNQGELNKKEEYYVNNIDSMYPNGYNLREGGDATGKLSNVVKTKMSISHTGKKHSSKTIDKISKSSQQRMSCKEFRKKLSVMNGSKPFMVYKIVKHNGKNIRSKDFIVLDTKLVGEWTNQSQCARDLNICSKNISACLNNKRKYYNFYIFAYKEL